MAGQNESQQAKPATDPMDQQEKSQGLRVDSMDRQNQERGATITQHETRLKRLEDFMDGFLRKAG